MGYAKPSMTTIFNLEPADDLSASLRDAHKAAALARYAVEGLICKSEHSSVDADDLNLIQEAIFTAGAHVFRAKQLHEGAVAQASTPTRAIDRPPAGVVPLRPKGA